MAAKKASARTSRGKTRGTFTTFEEQWRAVRAICIDEYHARTGQRFREWGPPGLGREGKPTLGVLVEATAEDLAFVLHGPKLPAKEAAARKAFEALRPLLRRGAPAAAHFDDLTGGAGRATTGLAATLPEHEFPACAWWSKLFGALRSAGMTKELEAQPPFPPAGTSTRTALVDAVLVDWVGTFETESGRLPRKSDLSRCVDARAVAVESLLGRNWPRTSDPTGLLPGKTARDIIEIERRAIAEALRRRLPQALEKLRARRDARWGGR